MLVSSSFSSVFVLLALCTIWPSWNPPYSFKNFPLGFYNTQLSWSFSNLASSDFQFFSLKMCVFYSGNSAFPSLYPSLCFPWMDGWYQSNIFLSAAYFHKDISIITFKLNILSPKPIIVCLSRMDSLISANDTHISVVQVFD